MISTFAIKSKQKRGALMFMEVHDLKLYGVLCFWLAGMKLGG